MTARESVADTFADDSQTDESGLRITAQYPAGLDLSWLHDLSRQTNHGRAVKYRYFARVLAESPHGDLAIGALRGITETTVAVSDPDLIRRRLFPKGVDGVVRRFSNAGLYENLHGASEPFRMLFGWVQYLEGVVQRRVLGCSPLAEVGEILGGMDGENLARRLGLPPNVDPMDPQADELRGPDNDPLWNLRSGRGLRGTENISFFAARSTAALAPLADPDVQTRAFIEMAGGTLRYAPRHEDLYAAMLRGALPVRHAFDEGNQLSVSAMNLARDRVGHGCRKLFRMWGDPEELDVPAAVEVRDDDSPETQAGDIAAGYAFHLYRMPGDHDDAVRRLSAFFHCVLVNGEMKGRR
jgi:hypothetical protein